MPLQFETGTLTAALPFDFEQSLAFLRGFEPMQGEQDIAEGKLTKAIRVPERGGVRSGHSRRRLPAHGTLRRGRGLVARH